jgi:DNA-directed RNA polymerase sigma subunit (sigma70/sigma32)
LKRYAERGNALRTLEEVARIVGLTKQRVYQLERAALRKLAESTVLRNAAIELGIDPDQPNEEET